MILYVLYTVISLTSIAQALEFTPCKGGIMVPSSFEMTFCDKPPCPLKKGTNVTWTTTFTAADNYPEVITSMQATYMGVTRGYPGIDGKISCNGIYTMPDNVKVGCPIEKGKMYKHETSMQLKIPTPKVTLPVRYALRDKNTKKDFLCLEIPVTLI